MTTHLCAYKDTLATNVENEMACVKDDVLTRTATNRFMIPSELPNVYYKAALSANLTKARIYTPSLEVKRTVPYVIPHVRGEIYFTPTLFAVDKCEPMIPLVPTEELSFYATADAAVAAYGLVSLAPATLPPVPTGEIRLVRCTSATTLVANEWTSCKLTPDVSLEAGDYALIGMLPISANAIAARVIISGQVWRPGVPALKGDEKDVKECDPLFLTAVQRYLMGSFTHLTLPEVQFLSSAADTEEIVYLWIIKTG